MAAACFWIFFGSVLLAVVFATQNMPWPMTAALIVALGSFLLAIEAADNEEPN